MVKKHSTVYLSAEDSENSKRIVRQCLQCHSFCCSHPDLFSASCKAQHSPVIAVNVSAIDAKRAYLQPCTDEKGCWRKNLPVYGGAMEKSRICFETNCQRLARAPPIWYDSACLLKPLCAQLHCTCTFKKTLRRSFCWRTGIGMTQVYASHTDHALYQKCWWECLKKSWEVVADLDEQTWLR